MGNKLDLSVLVELVSEEELLDAAELLTESNLATKELDMDTSDMASAIGVFMSAVESVPVADEDALPTEVSDLYNKFSDKLAEILANKKKGEKSMAKAAKVEAKAETKKPQPTPKVAAKAAAPAAKTEKTAPAKAAEKAPAKEKSTGEFREGTSAMAILQAVRDAGKNGISKEQVVEKLTGKIETVSVAGRVKKILLSCLQKGLAKKEGGLYFPV